MLQGEIDNFVPADFLSSEGSRTLEFGDRVRLASGYGSAGRDDGRHRRRADCSTSARATSSSSDGDYGSYRLTRRPGSDCSGRATTVMVDEGYLARRGRGRRLPLRRPERPPRPRRSGLPRRHQWVPLGGKPGRVSTVHRPRRDARPQRAGLLRRLALAGDRRHAGHRLPVDGPDGRSVDLTAPAHPYTDLGWWKPVPVTQLVPQGFNFTESDSIGVGGLVVAQRRPQRRRRRTSFSAASTPAASTVKRDRAGRHPRRRRRTVSSSGGSSFDGEGTSLAVNAVIATNRVLSGARAFIDGQHGRRRPPATSRSTRRTSR